MDITLLLESVLFALLHPTVKHVQQLLVLVLLAQQIMPLPQPQLLYAHNAQEHYVPLALLLMFA